MRKNINTLQLLSCLSTLFLIPSIDAFDNDQKQKTNGNLLIWPQPIPDANSILDPYAPPYYKELTDRLRIRQAAILVVLAPMIVKAPQQ